ncbi:MAG: hypothetical protein WB646_19180 [Steroidobacteraceae bacterium]
MSRSMPSLLCLMLALLCGPAWTGDDEDQPATAAVNTAQPELSRVQQQAVGITVVHPLKANAAERIDAYGEVLDVASLIGDSGRLASSRAAERAAQTEAQRLWLLYKNGADASLRAAESAQAAAIEAQTQEQIAASAFELQWGPLARLADAQRAALIESLASGHSALLRADLPGRLRLGSIPQSATVAIDGAPVAARVLGPLARSAADSQSVGLLLQIDHPPSGLGAGARTLVSLAGAVSSGVIVPDTALLYGDQGVYVYRQSEQKDPTAKLQYTPVPVKLLQSAGAAWLVQGIDDNDLIVANGAGVLWSLQGLGTFSAEEEDHD